MKSLFNKKTVTTTTVCRSPRNHKIISITHRSRIFFTFHCLRLWGSLISSWSLYNRRTSCREIISDIGKYRVWVKYILYNCTNWLSKACRDRARLPGDKTAGLANYLGRSPSCFETNPKLSSHFYYHLKTRFIYEPCCEKSCF